MIAFVLLTAMVLVTMGVVIGVIAAVSLGIRREERGHSLETEVEDRMTRGARRMTGFSFSRPSFSLLSRETQITTKGPTVADIVHAPGDSAMPRSGIKVNHPGPVRNSQ